MMNDKNGKMEELKDQKRNRPLKKSLLMRLSSARNSGVIKAFSMMLAVMIVFGTTYSLIMPAITVDQESAEEMPGVYLEEEIASDGDYGVQDEGAEFVNDDGSQDADAANVFDDGSQDADAENVFDDASQDADYEDVYVESVPGADDAEVNEDSEWPAEDGATDEEYTNDENAGADEAYVDTAEDEFNDGELVINEEEDNDAGEDADSSAETPVYTYQETRLENISPVQTGLLGDVTFRLDYNSSAEIPDGSILSAWEIGSYAETEEEAAYEEWRLENLTNSADALIADLDTDWSWKDAAFFDVELTDPEGDIRQPASQIYLTVYFTNALYTDKVQFVREDTETGIPEILNPVDVGYTEDGGIYAGVFLVDSLLPFGVISGDSLQAISEQQAEEAAEDTEVLEEAQEIVDSDEEETEEEPLTADETAESDGVEEAESVAEPVLTESETESAAEPVLTESGTESAAEPVLTDSETESIAEPVLEEVIEYPAQSFKGSTENVVVTVLAPEGAFPVDTTMTVEDASDSVVSDITDAVSDGSKTVNKVHAVDITFRDSNGNEIEPLVPVKVTIAAEEKQAEEETLVVHVSDEGNVEQVEDAVVSERNGESSARLTMEAVAEEFSVYAIVYTVDFHWEVNGKIYDFSIPGGGFVSFTDLVEVLGITGDANSDENGDANEVEIAENAEENGNEEGTEESDINSAANRAFTLGDVEVSEATRKFVADVVSVEFSSPELVDVTKAEADTTVGQIKESHGLECKYSAELTEEQIMEINAQTVEAGDWALISVQPFTSQETLTVTMKNGEVFEIKVTDHQISTHVISDDGADYIITVTYDSDANIPDGSELSAKEILPDSQEYMNHLQATVEKLRLEKENNISFARFFDIQILKDGEKIEPTVPVEVKIEYANAIRIGEGDHLSIIHFADQGTEVIKNLDLSDDKREIMYQQSSFSVTGTIISSDYPSAESKYMVILRYPQNSDNYYIVNSDGSLTRIDYSNGTVSVEYPMLWTVEGDNPNRHIYFNTEATGFNWQDTAADYFRRYIDPSAENGITEENAKNVSLRENIPTGYTVSNRDNILGQTATNTYGNHLYREPWTDDNHLGVELDENGTPVHIAGGKTAGAAAQVYFAEARSVPGVGAANHTVDHIDISISGKSNITVPLAFGTYYYQDNQGSWHEYTVTTNTSLDLSNNNVSITADDMKHATIKAYNKNGEELNDAFVVTGYSSNASNAYSTVQVRIEGQFKVADLQPPTSGDPNSADNKAQRYNNKIKYTVSAIKPLTFDLIDTEHGYGQLYEKQADGTYKALSVTVDVNMTASFDYWDERNECPALKDSVMGWGTNWTWQNGGIPGTLSGMDFVLGGDADDADAKIVAVEITKMIVDENNHLIPLKTSIVQPFDLYGSTSDSSNNVIGVDVPSYDHDSDNYDYNSYSKLHSKSVQVGTSGMGLVYDYDVTPGMYYIEEDASKIPQSIIDSNGEEWQYVETRIETEYVWRNDMYSGRHVSPTYTDPESDSYKSIPEVAGNYTGLLNPATTEQPSSAYNSTTWNSGGNTGTYRNGFLEFFVYNVYKPKETDITLKKVDKNKLNEEIPDLLKGASFTVTKYSDQNFRGIDSTWGTSGSMTVSDDKNPDGTYTRNGTFVFSGLPAGYYQIEETRFPDGYIKLSDNPRFEIVENQNHVLEISLIKNPDNLLLLKDNNLTIIVGNPPGAALPNTGGPGTNMLYFFGIMLAGLAGTGLVMKRRRRKNVA